MSCDTCCKKGAFSADTRNVSARVVRPLIAVLRRHCGLRMAHSSFILIVSFSKAVALFLSSQWLHWANWGISNIPMLNVYHIFLTLATLHWSLHLLCCYVHHHQP